MTLVLSVLEQGMIYAIMALGIYITYTILDFPDLTVDGSFPLGAALSAVLITKGVNPILTLLVTFAAGAFAGMLTGIIHVKLKVRDLLSGIIMMTALYTVNLRIAGSANLPIYNMTTLFDNDFVRNVFKGGLAQFSNVIIILVYNRSDNNTRGHTQKCCLFKQADSDNNARQSDNHCSGSH